jgi:hypothetical protein
LATCAATDSLGLVKAVGAPAGVGRMTFSDKDLYLAAAPSLRRIRAVLGPGH